MGCGTFDADPVHGSRLHHGACGRRGFHASPKSKDGTLESRAGWKGLCRKGVTLLIVLVACHLDTVMGSNFIRDATVIAFIANETLSIIENAGLMGVPIPKELTGAIEILKQKSEQDNMEE